jgi:hypothetical protein
MTNTVFPTFQTQYILDFSTASHSTTLGCSAKFYLGEIWVDYVRNVCKKNLPNTEIFQSKDFATVS